MNGLGFIEVCRTCATPPGKGSPYTSLFEVPGPMKCVSEDIMEIMKMLQLEIKQNDGLPQIICFSCLKTLAAISEFWKRCKDVQTILSFYHKSAQPCYIPKRTRNNDAKKTEELRKANIESGHIITNYGIDKCGYRFANAEEEPIDSKANNSYVSVDFDLVGLNMEYGAEKTEIEIIDEEFINGISSDDDIEELNNTDWKCEFSIDSNGADGYELPPINVIENNDTTKNIKEEPTINEEQIRKPKPKIQKYQCPHCFKYFQVMVNHLRSCPARAHICKYCDLAFETSTVLSDHIGKMHPEDLYACHVCSATFESIKLRWFHIRKEHTSRFKCGKCGREFRTKIMRNEHFQRRHTEKINKKCDLCNKVLKTEFLFRRHLKQHEMVDQLKCQFCEKVFTRRQFRLNHERIHKGERPFLCEVCGEGFAALVDLNRHKSGHLEDDENDGKETRPKRRSWLLKKYVGNLRFKCGLCTREFATSYGLNSHLKLHTEDRKYVCKQCGNRFTRLPHLQMHERRMHTKVKQYSCPECGKMFYEKCELNLHMPVHQEERPFECPHCPAKFKVQRRLTSHLSKHTTTEPYVCQCCGKGYKSLRNLQTHFQSHTKEEIQEIERKLVCDIENYNETKQVLKKDEDDIIEELESELMEFDYITEI